MLEADWLPASDLNKNYSRRRRKQPLHCAHVLPINLFTEPIGRRAEGVEKTEQPSARQPFKKTRARKGALLKNEK